MVRADPLIGSVIAERYRLDRRIASTDISVVYEAADLRAEAPGEAPGEAAERRCAVKILHAAREDVAARCIREAEAMARVANAHVVEALDHGILPSRNVFIAMEFLDGESLSATLEREGPLPWRRVVHLGRQIAEAAAATHAEGIIHRDIKPGNCMRIDRDGDPDFVKLLDFGISRNLDARFPTLTAQGAVLGTPAYMAPELTATGEPSIASDIYSFGATLYQLLTGSLPFTGETLVDYYYHHCYTPLTPPSQRAPEALPEGLEALVLRAMSKAPEGRFPSMIAAIDALDALLPTGERPPPVQVPERVAPARSSGSLEAETITSATPRPAEEVDSSDVDTNVRSPGGLDETPVHETELGDGTPLPFAATRTAATPGMSMPARSSVRGELLLPRSGLLIRGAVLAALVGLFTV
ncbi:MAG: serine/threonine protein kinase, partial [Myxococcales bacterium]|nr:serine/threonine protein kinase [Myxococcales bacterium]